MLHPAPPLGLERVANCATKVHRSNCSGGDVLSGAGRPEAAKRAVSTSLLITWSLQLVYLSGIVVFRSALAHAFLPYSKAGSPEVDALLSCILLIAVGSIGDWTNCTLAGALQGSGRQGLGAKIYGCTHWMLGTTLLWLLAFHLGWGVRGIWAALAVVSNVQCVFMAVCASSTSNTRTFTRVDRCCMHTMAIPQVSKRSGAGGMHCYVTLCVPDSWCLTEYTCSAPGGAGSGGNHSWCACADSCGHPGLGCRSTASTRTSGRRAWQLQQRKRQSRERASSE